MYVRVGPNKKRAVKTEKNVPGASKNNQQRRVVMERPGQEHIAQYSTADTARSGRPLPKHPPSPLLFPAIRQRCAGTATPDWSAGIVVASQPPSTGGARIASSFLLAIRRRWQPPRSFRGYRRLLIGAGRRRRPSQYPRHPRRATFGQTHSFYRTIALVPDPIHSARRLINCRARYSREYNEISRAEDPCARSVVRRGCRKTRCLCGGGKFAIRASSQ